MLEVLMAKKQTRRSVSIRGTTYERIRAHCEQRGLSMSEFVEELIAQHFDGGVAHSGVAAHGGVAATPQQPATQPAQPAPVKESVADVAPAPAPAPKPQAKAPAVEKTPDEKLDIDQLHDAARHFTF
jgi:hypothetical protein